MTPNNLPRTPSNADDEKEVTEIDRKLLCVLYLLAFLDRTNIGNAKIGGLQKDMHNMSIGNYNAALSIFFISYALFEPVTNVMLKRFRPSIFVPIIIIAWGLCMTFMGFVENWSGLMAVRWFLGLAEAGLFPGISYYLSCWYKRSEFGVRVAIFFSAAAVSGSFGGLLAAAILKMDGLGGLHGWAWIFILEGIVTVLAGFASFWLVYDFPEKARFLSEVDRNRVIRRLQTDQQSVGHEEFGSKFIWQAVQDYKMWLGMVIYMGACMPLYAFSLFLPTIIIQLGYTTTKAQLLSVPPYVTAAFLTVIIGFIADRTRQRGLCNIYVSLISIAGFSMLLASEEPRTKYAATFFGALEVATMGKPTPTPSKTQKSISSFFTPKSSQKPQNSNPPPASGAAGNLYDAERDEAINEVTGIVGNGLKRAFEEDSSGGNTGTTGRQSKRAKGVYVDEEDDESSTRVATNAQKPSPRTNKYMFSGSSQFPAAEPMVEEEPEAESEKVRKAELHNKFVKKLGHPDSIRRTVPEDNAVIGDGDEEEEDEEEAPAPVKTKKKGAKTGKLTPMELQVIDIKRKHMDTLLIVECSALCAYRASFRFDEHPSEAHLNYFASASIPVHRLPVHAKRLVAAGYKIGIVRQTETACIEKGWRQPERSIHGLDSIDAPSSGAPATGYLLCITETKAKGWGTDEKVEVGILAVQPATGDVIYDNFEDGFMRGEIETRLLHIAPCEFLIVGELTKATDKLVRHLSGSNTNVFGDRIRVERVEKPKTMAAESYSHVAQFYADKLKAHQTSNNEREQELLEKVLELTEPVTICLSAMITHMTEYRLEHVFDLTKYFQSFSARSHMLLNGNTLTSLEIYTNQTDHTEKGSLFWTLDKTQTKFGQRLLRKWVGRPLLDKQRLEERVAAVEELKENANTPKVDKLNATLREVRSDLERSLLRIYYGKCARPELLTILQTMQRIANEFAQVKTPSDAGFESAILNEAIASLPAIGEIVISFLDKINAQAARKDDKHAFFLEDYETEEIYQQKCGIAAVEQDLEAHRTIAATKLSKKTPVTYITIAGIEYLIEVLNTDLKNVPASWAKISGTKKHSRFHTPKSSNSSRERDQYKESLSSACDSAFSSFLAEISTHYAVIRDTISNLATIDCLLSLATVASLPVTANPPSPPPLKYLS
ncbi:hypothetical protein DID88_007616 [Monilinia fructigena]|uniref:MutS protein homolog 3 n=1 Tax=Monilinia fructigena TaxID=38457 RepID=A0A395J590_9HELO|nr:hypothetical protein DID88_007616 [Monilinia fructigena]